MPPRAAGLSRKPCPNLPDMNMSDGLMRTGLVEPRSESGPHQLLCQSSGWKLLRPPSVALVSTTESLSCAPEQGIALPVEKKTWPVESSITMPPAAHDPAP